MNDAAEKAQMTDRQYEQLLEQTRSEMNKIAKDLEALDVRVAAMVENINLLRGDPQRVAAKGGAVGGRPSNASRIAAAANAAADGR